jgi:hypothetical protein
MLVDRTEQTTVSEALEELDNRWLNAEDQAHRNGELYAWLWCENRIMDAIRLMDAQTIFIEQFGPWMQRRLADVFWIATKNITPTS